MGGATSRTTRSRAAFGFAAVAFAVAAIAAGCGDDDDDGGGGGGGGSGGGAAAEETSNIGLAMIGPRNDKGFSQDHYEGVVAATEELPVELNGTVENASDAQKRLDAFRNLAPNNDVVIGASVTFVDTAATVAPEFPDTDFIINSPPAPEKIDNLTSLVLEEGQPSVLAGVTMATLTKSDRIGVIAGAEVPASQHKIEGVKVGAGEVDPGVRVVDALTGDYNDVGRAKDAAAAMIANGVDQILGDLDVGIQGVYEAVQESGKDIGVYQVIDLSCEEDDSVVGAVIYDNGALMQEAIRAYTEESLEPGAIFFSMETPEILRFEVCPEYEENEELMQSLEETEAAILDGSLELERGPVLNELPSYEVQER